VPDRHFTRLGRSCQAPTGGQEVQAPLRPQPQGLQVIARDPIEDARAAARTRDTYLAGPNTSESAAAAAPNRASLAVTHALVVVVWHMLQTGEPTPTRAAITTPAAIPPASPDASSPSSSASATRSPPRKGPPPDQRDFSSETGTGGFETSAADCC
jgi:hypothetical protein